MALVAYKRIQKEFPDFVDGWTNGSVILFEMGRSAEAFDMATRAIELAPENPTAICAMANAQQSLGKIEEAQKSFQKVLELDPNNVPALTNLAGIYNRAGQFEEAINLDDRAIKIQPLNSVLWGNRGHSRMRALDLCNAESDFCKALELDDTNALSRWNLAYVQLLQHRYHSAWPNFRARMALNDWAENNRNFGKPQWNGEPLCGRTLLIYSEQGFGDTLQFVRFIPRLAQFGGKILLSTSRLLQNLLSGIAGIDGMTIEGEPLPDYDLVVPLMELPVILDVDISDLAPLPPPSLPARQPIPELTRSGYKVGLVWAGSPAHTNDGLRSMSPRFLDMLADLSDIAWYGLQKPPAIDPPRLPGFIDLSPYMHDFLDTAQLIKQLDLVVTVDTAVAHVTGFIGKPAIVMLAYLPDWRWGIDELLTPWYPSLELVRQSKHGDWQGVVNQLKIMIGQRAGSCSYTKVLQFGCNLV